MKILQIHNKYQQHGGEDAVVQAEYDLLLEHGHQVSLLEVNNDHIKSIFQKVRVAVQCAYSIDSSSLVHSAILKHKPDVVHVHNFFPILTPSIFDACNELKVPVVQTLHNYRLICSGALLMRDGSICEDCITGSAYQAVLHRCYRNSYIGTFMVAKMLQYHRKKHTWNDKVNRFIALTEFAKEKFVEAGFSPDKITVKSNFTKSDSVYSAYSKSNECTALFVGRLSVEKGIETLLEAWNRLSLSLRIIGNGPLLGEIISQRSKKINILGELKPTDVAVEMEQSSFLVMPSEWYEGFPMVLVESFSHGLPVVASRLGSMAEIVEDGVTGLHFEPGNSDDLAEKVLWMQEHPDKCKEMGENARRVYEKKYTPESNCKILMQIYQEVIDECK